MRRRQIHRLIPSPSTFAEKMRKLRVTPEHVHFYEEIVELFCAKTLAHQFYELYDVVNYLVIMNRKVYDVKSTLEERLRYDRAYTETQFFAAYVCGRSPELRELVRSVFYCFRDLTELSVDYIDWTHFLDEETIVQEADPMTVANGHLAFDVFVRWLRRKKEQYGDVGKALSFQMYVQLLDLAVMLGLTNRSFNHDVREQILIQLQMGPVTG